METHKRTVQKVIDLGPHAEESRLLGRGLDFIEVDGQKLYHGEPYRLTEDQVITASAKSAMYRGRKP